MQEIALKIIEAAQKRDRAEFDARDKIEGDEAFLLWEQLVYIAPGGFNDLTYELVDAALGIPDSGFAAHVIHEGLIAAVGERGTHWNCPTGTDGKWPLNTMDEVRAFIDHAGSCPERCCAPQSASDKAA